MRYECNVCVHLIAFLYPGHETMCVHPRPHCAIVIIMSETYVCCIIPPSLHTHTQDIQMCVNSLLHRDIKLHFLQILAPGHVYPDRSSPHVPYGSCPSSPSHQEEGNLHSLHSKKFNVEDLGPTWETVETIPGFIFPGEWGMEVRGCEGVRV